jgi:hypothetical protein
VHWPDRTIKKAEIPSSKDQAPENIQTPNQQNWMLEFGVSLVPGRLEIGYLIPVFPFAFISSKRHLAKPS